MTSSVPRSAAVAILVAFLGPASGAFAQPAAAPLGIQGLDRFTVSGVRSRGMGGTATASVNDASALFSNPAGLSRLAGFELRAGGLLGSTKNAQTQVWTPMRPLPGLSVLFEGLTGNVTPPQDTTLPPWDRLQVPYDNITPNWETSSSSAQMLSLVAAAPFSFEGVDLAAGVGFAQVINLDQYYQNNNSMTPYLGQQRPDPGLITDPIDTLHVQWYQYVRAREGGVYGITPGVSIAPIPELRLGGSVTFLTGSSDDSEQRVERGHISIEIETSTPQNFLLDTVRYYQQKTGTSKYSGTAFTFGLLFQQKRYGIGFTVRPPMTLTRAWSRQVTSLDTTRNTAPIRVDSLTTRSYAESGEDYVRYPWSYSLGLVLTPTDSWTIAFDYELRQLGDVQWTSTTGTAVAQPWVNTKGMIRLGLEYRASDAVAVRAGFREDLQAFSPDGSAIIGEPARGSVYSVGAGFTVENIMLEAVYEYARLRYEDVYQSNVNYNLMDRHQVLMEIAYRF